MGGRWGAGGTSGNNEPHGRVLSIKRFFENLGKNDKEGMLQTLSRAKLEIKNARFSTNGNVVRSQEAILESGKDRISLRFFNDYDPMQIAKPNGKITQDIQAVVWKNGRAFAIRTLAETKSSSQKNAKKNYEEMLKKWKEITRQKTITF